MFGFLILKVLIESEAFSHPQRAMRAKISIEVTPMFKKEQGEN
jgi:hypothetical protein